MTRLFPHQVLSIGHASRVSGHRFRINDITCHPVLPLLLTTSHHNLPRGRDPSENEEEGRKREEERRPAPTEGFCSELILWKVESVGPLSKSGGVAELARINSLEPSAFSNVAWVPTLLPRSVTFCHSCFYFEHCCVPTETETSGASDENVY